MSIKFISSINKIKRFYTDEGVQQRYAARQSARPTENNRTSKTIALCLFLVFILFTSISSLLLIQRSEFAYLRSLENVHIFGPSEVSWNLYSVPSEKCHTRVATTCNLNNIAKNFLEQGTNVFAFRWQNYLGDGERTLLLSTRLKPQVWAAINSQFANVPTIFSVPTFAFGSAAVYINRRHVETFYNNETISVAIPPELLQSDFINIDLILVPAKAQKTMFLVEEEAAVFFVAQQPSYIKYADLLAAKRSGAGKQLADIARIVLAIFCILLFIFIDSSPECLGLAIFMGLKGVGVILAQNWLPSWLSPSVYAFDLKNFALCFGDIMQFYFFTQLSRLMKPKLTPWFVYGGLVALLYATAMHFDLRSQSIDWNNEIWRWRNVVIGACCLFYAFAAARYTFRIKMYSRTAALIIASSGVLVQIMIPLGHYSPDLFNSDWFRSFYNVFETHTPYVFALSTFINISTLEKRIKGLSQQVVLAKEIEREMALGRTVQQSLLRIPELPPAMDVSCHHEPAVYVSGDIYFVNWNESEESLTMLITDVTGHGVQAALKASICSTLAEAIWAETPAIRSTDSRAERLRIYDNRLHKYLTRMSDAVEMASVVGGEFDLRTRKMSFYRANGVFPIMVFPRQDGQGWEAQILPIKNREVETITLPEGAAILLLSDGYLSSSRVTADFSEYLTRTLDNKQEITAADLRDIVLSFSNFAATADDKTLLIFSYNAALSTKLPVSA